MQKQGGIKQMAKQRKLKKCLKCGIYFDGPSEICPGCALRQKIPITGSVQPVSVRNVSDDVFNIDPTEHFWSKPKETFIKNDSGKLQWSLMPFEQLEDVVRVLMNGAMKYERDNWKKCDDINRYKDSLMRHVTAYIEGNKFDNGPDGDNLHHLAHAIYNCLFILYFDKGDIEEWNRQLNEKMSV